MRIEIARRWEDIGVPRQEWERLLADSETNTIFQTPDWLLGWWTVFGHGQRLLFLKVYDGRELIGLAPMMIAEGGLYGNTLRFVGDPHADYQDFIVGRRKKEVVPRLIEELSRLDDKWAHLSLSNLPERSSTYELLRYTCECLDHPVVVRKRTACMSVAIEGHEHEAGKLARKYSLRRPGNYFRRQGELEVGDIHSVDEALSYMDVFFEQHVNRWHGSATPSLFLSQNNRDLYTEILRRLLPSGRLLFSVATFNGHPISFHYGFDYCGSVLWYKPSFDMGFHKRSPGLVMVKHLLDYSLEKGRRELDFTVGDEAFKHRYANVRRYNLDVGVFRQHGSYLFEQTYRRARTIAKAAFQQYRTLAHPRLSSQ